MGNVFDTIPVDAPAGAPAGNVFDTIPRGGPVPPEGGTPSAPSSQNIFDTIPVDGPVVIPAGAVVRDENPLTPDQVNARIGDVFAQSGVGRAAIGTARDIGQATAPVMSAATRFSEALPADVMAKVAGTPEFGGNIDAALTPAKHVPTSELPPRLIDPSTGQPVGPQPVQDTPAPQLPIQKAVQLAQDADVAAGKTPWASLAARTSLGLFGTAPKMAMMAAVPESLPAQMIGSGVLFSVDDNGKFHPEEVPFNALLPGVGRAARVATGAAIGAAISKGATALESPVAQKVLEEIGDQAGLNAFMLAQQSPQMVQLWKTDRSQFYQQMAGMVGQNLALRIGLGGAGEFNPEVNSQARNFIESNAEMFTQRTLGRLAGGDLVRQLNTGPIEPPAGPVREPMAEAAGALMATPENAPLPWNADLRPNAIPPEDRSGTIVPPNKGPIGTANASAPGTGALPSKGEQVPGNGEQVQGAEAPAVPGAASPADELIAELRTSAPAKPRGAKLAEGAPGGAIAAEQPPEAPPEDMRPTGVPSPAIQEADRLIEASLSRGDISQGEALAMKAQVRINAAKLPPEGGTLSAEPLTEAPEGGTTGLAAPETETGGTAPEVATPLRSTPTQKGVPPESGTIPVEGGETPSRSAAALSSGEAEGNFRKRVAQPGEEGAPRAASDGLVFAEHTAESEKGLPPRGTNKNYVQSLADDFRARYPGAPEARVVQSVDDLPEPYRKMIQDKLDNGIVSSGWYDTKSKQAWFIADHMRHEDAPLTIYEEMMGHPGMEPLLKPTDYARLFQDIRTHKPDKFAEIWRDYQLDDRGQYPTPDAQRRKLVSEYVAKEAPRLDEKDTLWGRVKDTLLRALSRIGLLPQRYGASALDARMRALARKAGDQLSARTDSGAADQRTQYRDTLGQRSPVREEDLRFSQRQSIGAGGENQDRSYAEVQRRLAAAEENLRQKIRVAGSLEARRNAGKSPQEARAEKNLAAAQLRRVQDELASHPDYVRDLLQQQDQVMRKLKPGPGVAKPEGRELAELEGRAADIEQALSRTPKKLIAKISDDLFFKGRPTASETAARTPMPDVGTEGRGSGVEGGEAAPPEEVRAAPANSADRLKQAVAALPEKAKGFFSGVRDVRRQIGNKLATMPNRDVMAYTKGAADNKAMVTGKQTANLVLHELNRAFGATGERVDAREGLRENALTFVIESGRDRGSLGMFRDTILGSEFGRSAWAKRALAAIAYADKHWERFQGPAQLYEKMTDAENAAENESGIQTLHRSGGYVFHLQDVHSDWAMPDVGAGAGGGPAAPFKHIRDHATYADAIASGVKPESLSAVDLLQRRITLGRKLVNYRAWTDSLSRVIDPATQLPLVTDTIVRARADGTQDETAPPGYQIQDFAGQTIAVHKGYEGLFDALTGSSWFSKGTLRPMLGNALTTSKHLQLAFDTYHLGRMAFWNAMVRGAGEGDIRMLLPGNPLSYKRGLTLLDNTPGDIQAMATRGEIPKEWADDLVEQKRRLGVLLDAGYNVGHSADNIYSHWVEKLPVAGQFNKWLFDKYVRGAMAESGLIELARQQKMHPEWSEQQAARSVSKDLNLRFGNLNNESWIKSPTGRDVARTIILAPSWNEGLIRSEMGAVKQLFQAPAQSLKARRLVIGPLGRATAAAVLGRFIANQVINFATRGQPTWNNKEEGVTAKMSAYIPDVVGNSPGFFLNPLALPAEMSNLLLKKTGRSGDFVQALREMLVGRMTGGMKAIVTGVTGKGPQGETLRGGWDVTKAMASSIIPSPLSGSAVYRGAKQLVTGQPEEKFPGQFQRQIFQTAGEKLEGVPSDEQRIRSLASAYNTAHGKQPDAGFYHNDYYDLDRALQIGNQRDIRAELQDLLQKKTRDEISAHYDKHAEAPFTAGSYAREDDFRNTLTPEQSQTYDRARQYREALRDKLQQALDQVPEEQVAAGAR